MFLQRKKGDIVTPFLVLTVLAVIMIFVVTGFGAKLLSSFYPSGDKSTLKSFDAFYNVINMNVVSNLDYELTPVSVYLKKGYCIVLFDLSTVSKGDYGVPGSEIYYKPTECEKDQCMCLYDNTPKQDASKKDKYVVECSKFSGTININPERYDISPILCSSSGERYIPLLIIGNKDLDKHYTYILNDNVERNKLADELKVRLCPTEAPELCRDKKDGTVITFDNDEDLDKIQKYCANPENTKKYQSTSITCRYNEDQKNCVADCSEGDVSADCKDIYEKCSDFNQIKGITDYISRNKDYKYYYMCNNSKNYCGLDCQTYPFEAYISQNADSRDGTIGPTPNWIGGYPENYPLLTNEVMQNCILKFSDRLAGGYRYLLSYDDSQQSCKDIIEQYFYPEKSTILTCKSSSEAACQELIANRREACTIKYYSNGDYLWISHYESSCDAEIKELFGEVYTCGDKPSEVTE